MGPPPAAAAAPVRSRVDAVLAAPSVVLFLSLLASQASVLVLSPILVDMAREFGVSTATVGQLRTISGVVAGVTALLLGRIAARVALRELLVVGLGLLAGASLLSGLAPTFAVLAAAQVLLGVGLAIVVGGGVAAAAEWAPPGERARVLSWALVGQPAAWVVGMPLAGAVAGASWRYAWLVVPLAASLLALIALSRCRRTRGRGTSSALLPLLRDRAVGAWALGELLAYSGWAGTLVYAGALFVESYGASVGLVGLVLGAVALAYLPGNFLARRVVDRAPRPLLVALPLPAAAAAAVLGTVRPALWVSAVVLGALAFLAGGRTIAGSAFGLDAAPERKLGVMGLRAAATQFGYLVGAAAGGLALAAGGYPALGLVLCVLFALAAVPHLVLAGVRG